MSIVFKLGRWSLGLFIGLPHLIFAAADTTTYRIKKRVESLYVSAIPGFLSDDTTLAVLYKGGALENFHLWDPIERMSGFTASLGLTGKPLFNFQASTYSKYRAEAITENVVLEYQSHRKQNWQTMPFLNTRTPFFDIEFIQAAGDLQQLAILASQNVNPLWNLTLIYNRLSALGFYPNTKVDHYNFAFTTNFRTLKKKLFLLASLAFDQFTDQMNGGSLQRGNTAANAFENSFGRAALPQLSAAQYFQRYRSFWMAPFYILPFTGKGKFIVNGKLRLEDQIHNYQDKITYSDSAPLLQASFPYAKIYVAQVPVDNFTRYALLSMNGCVSYRRPLRRQNHSLEVEMSYEQRLYTIASLGLIPKELKHSLQFLKARAFYQTPRIMLSVSSLWQTSKLLAPVLQYQAKLTYQPSLKKYEIEDSLLETKKGKIATVRKKYEGRYAPWQFHLSWRQASFNPSLQNLYWESNTFIGNAALQNEELLQTQIGATFQQKPFARSGFLHLQNFCQFSLYSSQTRSLILYNYRAEAIQLAGRNYHWIGLEVKLRQRFFVFYSETELTYQKNWSGESLLARYAESLPPFLGKLSIYYYNKISRRPITVKAGVDGFYFSAFRALQFEPSLRILYPQQNETISGYLRLDTYISAQIRTALVFFKLAHFNEGFWQAGYYTVPFYPMFGRNFCFGIRWQLFD
jgi:hypothetical protein